MNVIRDERFVALLEARLSDPFSLLGRHKEGGSWVVRVFQPHARSVALFLEGHWQALERVHPDGLFAIAAPDIPEMYRLKAEFDHASREFFDPYAFIPHLPTFDLYLFNEGRLFQAYNLLGANVVTEKGVMGTRFAVWAPNAERVSVVGDFNGWDGRVHAMHPMGNSGVWCLFIPELFPGNLYKFEIRNRFSGEVLLKTDPYGRFFEVRPNTAAIVMGPSNYEWQDESWLEQRRQFAWQHRPISIYEVHLGSWQRENGHFLGYRELAERLIPYMQDLGFTHIEIMPITEHPLDDSWGYQSTGYFAPTSRYGSPDDFRAFVDAFHKAGLGVILDWVPGHFPKDAFALARFDGTAVYEHADPRLGEHKEWGTLIFNYGRYEVKSFLLSSAYYWLKEFHLDGLRIDAVASMLYLDYSRKPGEWLPNRYGGRENLEAIEFLRELNTIVHGEFAGAVSIAEESTAWPMVSRPVHLGGLGFSMKWNMGWMNDTLRYISQDPIHRAYYHDLLTFSQVYAYTENFVLPLSHDEIVHGKKSLIDKMPGDVWQRFANVRLLFFYQMTHPGKKLNFMGNEFAHGREWNVHHPLDWDLLDIDWHEGIARLFADLTRLYVNDPVLHHFDFSQEGFEWIDCHDAQQSVISYIRKDKDGRFLVIILNFTPVIRSNYRIGVPQQGSYEEILNSDHQRYRGSGVLNQSLLATDAMPWMGRPYSLCLTLPPLAGVILKLT